MPRPRPLSPPFAVATLCLVAAAAPAAPGAWPDGKELAGRLLDLARHDRADLHEIGISAGGQKLRLLEIAPERPRAGGGPAVLVVGDAEGALPLAALASVELAAAVLAAPAGSTAGAVRWYVLPVASPDGLDGCFARPRAAGGGNATPVDEDQDGAEGEDPPDDLDGDGLVTWMLVADPAGAWTLSAAGVPLAVDPARSPADRYRREIEGLDQDGDGRYNEDPPGGVDIARNFPHDFAPWTPRGGRWPADQPETRAILEFAFGHPDIALVVVLGGTSNLWRAPAPAVPEADAGEPVAVPWRLARELGLEPNALYPPQSVIDLARERGARLNLTPARVRAMLHLEPLRQPPAEDIGWWAALGEHYRAYLAEHGLDAPRLEPPAPGPGSPAGWAYFQFGVPAVALDLWTLPAPADTAAADTTVAPAARRPEPARELVLLQERAAQRGVAGWRAWTPVTLPGGASALVGGPEPGAATTPPAGEAERHARALVPFLLDLPAWLPRLEIAPPVLVDRGGGVREVTVRVSNTGRLPYPTTMGTINQRPAPVVVELAGAEPLLDPARRVVPQLPAGGAVELHWLVRADRPDRLEIAASAPSLGSLTVKGGGR
ncbi:MAG TPA: M14 family zinc carboxypeptidase [Candidatus Krumholzibacteria bacterium]|nr:M14 family zinc carboxypeptidase [Candidatus Krumholzibacteria bacterium]HPD72889.1 M14 family zinc carboxypeptidase [Candidatus Krumholzibacteria bacterium]HRY41688.1 M14 family zinc carboxypeptidase [Candidatus Krumholzibacteria bacterium]